MNNRVSTGRFLLTSYLLSLLCLIGISIINQKIAIRYQESSGKTSALFGIIELQYSYIYYLVLPALVGLILGILSFKQEQTKAISAIAVLVACLTIALVFLRIWRLLV